MFLDSFGAEMWWVGFSSVLILIGLLCLIIEAQIPGFGVFGATGIVSLAAGTILLLAVLEKHSPGENVLIKGSIPVIVLAIVLLLVMYKITVAMQKKPTVGTVAGNTAVAVDSFGKEKEGFVRLNGEYWKAISEEVVHEGDEVEVINKKREKLVVKKRYEEQNT